MGKTLTHLEQLLDRLAAGDTEARSELIQVASERLVHLARRMLANYPHLRRWEQTDDIFQEAVIRLHRSLKDVQPTSVNGFFGLAMTQVRRTLIDLVRHHFGPEGAAAHHDSDAGFVASNQSQRQKSFTPAANEVAPETFEQWAKFHETVEEFPEEVRKVFELLWYGGMTQAETAEALSISVPTVRRRWYRARHLIWEALSGEKPET